MIGGGGAGFAESVAASLDEKMPEEMLKEMFDGDRLVPWRGRVEDDWTDYNNHMTEYRYLHVFSLATDELLLACGGGAGYVAQGFSFYTAETHIRHIDEVAAGAEIYVETRVLSAGGKNCIFFMKCMRRMGRGVLGICWRRVSIYCCMWIWGRGGLCLCPPLLLMPLCVLLMPKRGVICLRAWGRGFL